MGLIASIKAFRAEMAGTRKLLRDLRDPNRPRRLSAINNMPNIREATNGSIPLHLVRQTSRLTQSDDPRDDFPEFKKLRKVRSWAVADAGGDLWIIEVRKCDHTGAVLRGCFCMAD